jgi:hypothetical protein
MSYAEEDTRVSYAEEDTCIYCNIYIRLIMLDDLRSSPRFTFPMYPPPHIWHTCILLLIYDILIMLDDLRSSPRFTFPSPPPLTLLTSHCPRPV